jgi:hypothetical protein
MKHNFSNTKYVIVANNVFHDVNDVEFFTKPRRMTETANLLRAATQNFEEKLPTFYTDVLPPFSALGYRHEVPEQ